MTAIRSTNQHHNTCTEDDEIEESDQQCDSSFKSKLYSRNQWRILPLLLVTLLFLLGVLCIVPFDRRFISSSSSSSSSLLSSVTLENSKHRRLKSSPQQQPQKTRILYIVTTLNEYNSGTRNTVRGSDRLQETLIPVLTEGVESMIATGVFEVDVVLVCHFTLRDERRALLQAALPANVGLQVWNDATPLGYDTSKLKKDDESAMKNTLRLENRTLHLAREHRFVIKDKLLEYDMFVNFEDDMVIKAEHVMHYMAVTNELKRLEDLAPESLPDKPTYHGQMTKGQLRRMIPGFMRVEVLLDEDKYGAQSDTGPIPLAKAAGDVNASVCCAMHHTGPHRPASPTPDKLMIWETNILPLGIRRMPSDSWLDWVVLQRGPNQNGIPKDTVIADWWSNEHHTYYPKPTRRPAPQEFKYINNQGGWMATRDQLWRWHTDLCPGGFLPPYEGPHYNHDGLDMRNVEWYSGGMQLSTVRHACNLQRIVLLESANFSHSLLYHSANNKQRQLTYKKDSMFTKANTMLAQLYTVKMDATKDMGEEVK